MVALSLLTLGVIGYKLVMTYNLFSFAAIAHLVEIAQGNRLIAFGFFLIFVVGVMGLPITPFPIIGGVLFPFWLAFPMNVLAATMGAYCSFLVARFAGRDVVEPFIRGKLKSLDQMTEEEGFKTVLLLRVIGIPPFIVTNYGLGLSGVRHRDFLLATAIGMTPWMGMTSYLARGLWNAALVGGNQGLSKALSAGLFPLTLMSLMVLFGLSAAWIVKKTKIGQKKKENPPV